LVFVAEEDHMACMSRRDYCFAVYFLWLSRRRVSRGPDALRRKPNSIPLSPSGITTRMGIKMNDKDAK